MSDPAPPSSPVVAGAVLEIRAATVATATVFAASGFAFASWASRIAQVRDQLSLSSSALGLVLLAIAAGSIVSLPSAGPIVARFGSRRVVAAMSLLLAAGLVVAAFGAEVSVVAVVAGLVLLGFGNGAWDVAMNVQGAVVERLSGRSIMSRFHAAFSVGTVGGALVGAGLVALAVPVWLHLVVVAGLVAVVVPMATRRFVPDTAADPDGAPDDTAAGRQIAARFSVLQAWREPRTLLIGVLVLCFAFAEGVGNDWISVALIDGYGAPAAIGTLVFALFLAAMTAGRWFGPAWLDRWGRVAVLRVLSLVGIAGVVVFVFAPSPVLAAVGGLLWGFGTSLGFPVGMSAAADDPLRAATRVSVVASIGYCAFLAGPPLIGFLGHEWGVLRATVVVAVLLGVAVLVSPATRPAGAVSGRAGHSAAGPSRGRS
ncbi:MFS transporter [Nakamurella leprariae]|uniref:MFS transporter n=1 Tax=Nakamurella leprariae TaxID=2803911 RepID=A0A939C3Q3_9ACTN|nr:MFS transporter [Nakamurella leprariae]MBM9469317.1 MFS transporter [Nakamurella leprariae]